MTKASSRKYFPDIKTWKAAYDSHRQGQELPSDQIVAFFDQENSFASFA